MEEPKKKKQNKKKKGKKPSPSSSSSSSSSSPSPSSSSSTKSPPSFLLSKQEKDNLLKMEGSWALDLNLSDSYDPVLKYMGMGWIKRSAAGRAVSIHHVKFDFDNNGEEVEEEEKGRPVLNLNRDVELVGYNVGASSMKFILDGEDRDLDNDDQSFAESSFASAYVREGGKEIVGTTTFLGKDGKKAVEEEVRTLKTENGEEMMVLTIRFIGDPDTDLTMTRILRKRE